jgi:GNAT superfamily N-acetyltransferase
MEVRLVSMTDYDALRDLAAGAAEESEAGLGFEEESFYESFHRCFTGDLTCWVCEEDGKLVGFLLAVINGFYFAAGLACSAEVVYVTPAKRGSRAPALLIDEFFRWSEIVGARRKHLGINNALHPERTARFFERYGAKRVGVYLAAD